MCLGKTTLEEVEELYEYATTMTNTSEIPIFTKYKAIFREGSNGGESLQA